MFKDMENFYVVYREDRVTGKQHLVTVRQNKESAEAEAYRRNSEEGVTMYGTKSLSDFVRDSAISWWATNVPA